MEFSQSQLEAIARALGDTDDGLTGTEIDHVLALSKIENIDPAGTKWVRLHNAFAANQNKLGHRRYIQACIRFAMKPERHLHRPERFERLRALLNRALAFAGIAVDEDGQLLDVEAVTTIADASKRARELRIDLLARGAHADVLQFCRAELVADNYFHAVLEATKSVAAKLRQLSGLTSDGAPLVDAALGGDRPRLRINALTTESERGEQRGFANLLKGMFGMFRNTTAHEPKILWQVAKSDAEDLLSMASLIHRRLDGARKTSPDHVE